MAGFLLVNKVYSPQYVLWLLPLAVLARPRWRDQLSGRPARSSTSRAVWWYLGGYLARRPAATPAVLLGRDRWSGWPPSSTSSAIVVRDVLLPRHDPVRADGLTDDPAEPTAVA